MTPPETTISVEQFRKFRDYFYHQTGIYFEDTKRYFVDRRLLDRMASTGSQSFRDYFAALHLGLVPHEWQALVNSLTINETYFFREEYQFRCLVDSMLPELVASKGNEPLRLWSIPSSSGEETYSIAIYLLEYWDAVDRHDIELVGSDIDTHALAQARRGIYSRRSVQNLPPHLLSKYFTPVPPDSYQLSPELIGLVSHTQVNLTDPKQMAAFRGYDAIFCRNLLIYFDDLSRRLAAEALYDALRPGGFLCLGHSESMSRISPIFEVRKFPEGLVYQKPARSR